MRLLKSDTAGPTCPSVKTPLVPLLRPVCAGIAPLVRFVPQSNLSPVWAKVMY